MKKVLIFLCLVNTLAISFGQKVRKETLLEDDISIRALEIWDGKVWYTGTASKFGYVDIANPAERKQIKVAPTDLQFRTLAQNDAAFYTINIESPAHIFRIAKKDLTVTSGVTDAAATAFYDALHYSDGYFYTFSDPAEDLVLQWSRLKDADFPELKPLAPVLQMKTGEAAFAASNSNIASAGDYVWLATGGAVARIFRYHKKTGATQIFETPFVQGNSTQGIYAIDFYNAKKGIAVGGDYTKQKENRNNIATTSDGGKTWQIRASGKNGGYKTCVKYRPGSHGNDILAVGDQMVEYSADGGKSWNIISNEKGLYVCVWADRNTAVLAGKNKILKMTFEQK